MIRAVLLWAVLNSSERAVLEEIAHLGRLKAANSDQQTLNNLVNAGYLSVTYLPPILEGAPQPSPLYHLTLLGMSVLKANAAA